MKIVRICQKSHPKILLIISGIIQANEVRVICFNKFLRKNLILILSFIVIVYAVALGKIGLVSIIRLSPMVSILK